MCRASRHERMGRARTRITKMLAVLRWRSGRVFCGSEGMYTLGRDNVGQRELDVVSKLTE